MAVTNDYERDFNDTAFLKRPGRIDLIVFQNSNDVGDGKPGLQKCFRNYLHTGGFENDLNLVGHGIKGTSVDINNVELQQLSNIGASVITSSIWQQLNNIETVTITNTQWGYLGVLDQNLRTSDNVQFANINLADDIIHVGDTDNLISFGTDTQNFQTGGSSRMDISNAGVRFGATGVRITHIENNDSLGTSDVVLCTQGNVKAYTDAHANSDGSSHTYINQDVQSTASPTFANINIGDDIRHTGESTNKITFIASTQTFQPNGSTQLDLNASGMMVGGTGARVTEIATSISNSATKLITASAAYAHTSASNPHSISLDKAFDQGKRIDGANSISNALKVGIGSGFEIAIYHDGGGKIVHTGGNLHIGSYSAPYFEFDCNTREFFWTNGDNQCNLGTTSRRWAEVYHCGLTAGTCADFSSFKADEIYDLLSQIKPRKDVYEKMNNGEVLPHIDMGTMPDIFADIANEDFEGGGVCDKKGEDIKIPYKKGEKCGADFENIVWALKDLVLKSYSKIKELEKEIEFLKSN